MPAQNFDKHRFVNKVADFSNPTQLPANEQQAARWQQANKSWWESSPMRYDWRDTLPEHEGSREYFAAIDERFFSAVRAYMPWRQVPFDNLIDFAGLASKDVLEIGVGHGSHAQLLAAHCKSFAGIDLTAKAAAMTRQRFAVNGLVGDIRQMDAEAMAFADNSFDFIWSWGVIHHSANTLRILREMQRVLRPGGTAVVMVYHRSWWKYYVMDGFFKGLLCGELFHQQRRLHAVSQAQTDGAIARYYKVSEWRNLCAPLLPVTAVMVTGQKLDMVPLPAGKVKAICARVLPDGLARFFTNTLRFGSFLIAWHEKRNV